MSLLEQILENPPHIHLGVSGILEYYGSVLLGQRSAGDEALPGMWCSPGGGVEFGETLDQALAREFMEETHLRVIRHVGFQTIGERFNEANNRHTVLIFREVALVAGNPSKLVPGDGFDKLAWFSPDAVEGMSSQITPLTLAALREYKQIIKP